MAQKYTINEQWEQYLKLTNQNPETMAENQYIETKRAFFGACGQMLVLLRDEISVFPEAMSVQIMKKMMDEIGTFWNRQK